MTIEAAIEFYKSGFHLECNAGEDIKLKFDGYEKDNENT